jgi:hypothetical protein
MKEKINVKKIRKSNIELLRIISMVIIIIYHSLLHAVIPNSSELISFIKPLTAILHIGVICFVLISGYWGIKFSLTGFMKLFLYCSFYSILIFIVGVLLNPDLFNFKNGLKALIPFQWWFVQIYLCLFLLVPIVNIPLKNANKETKIIFILILLTISFVLGQFVPSLQGGKNPINFILIYYIGNYLRTEFVMPESINTKKIIYIYVIFNCLFFITMLFTENYLIFVNKALFRVFFPYNGFGLMINSILFFLIFTRLNFSSKVVNWLASSSLSVYLLHENEYLSLYLYNYIEYFQSYIDNSIVFSFFIILFSILIFTVAVFIDKLISPIFYFIIKRIISFNFFIKAEVKYKRLLEPNKINNF